MKENSHMRLRALGLHYRLFFCCWLCTVRVRCIVDRAVLVCVRLRACNTDDNIVGTFTSFRLKCGVVAAHTVKLSETP